jgi:uncharacterized membrane-anchored protein YitT (DUF2179 family)
LPDDVCEALSKRFGKGLTVIKAKGYYSGSEKSIIYFVVNRFQIGRMKEIVHRSDSNAYIAISEVADIFRANADID